VEPITEPEAIQDLGVSAYLYLYPLVLMELTRRQSVGDDTSRPGVAPVNRFSHFRAFPPAGFTTVVRPNFDTLYSSAWLDLTGGPVVVSTEEVPGDRYYQLPMYDMWSDAFAAPGQRTNGNTAASWAVTPPGWHGSLPDGLARIAAPTPCVWVIGRTQTDGPVDYEAVHRIQDGYSITPLDPDRSAAASAGSAAAASAATAAGLPEVEAPGDPSARPLFRTDGLSAEEFFDFGLGLLAQHPPHLTDWTLVAELSRIGLVAGARIAGLDPVVRTALTEVPSLARAEVARLLPTLANVVNGWQMNLDTMGVYGNFYAKRAIVAMVGLGANSPEDAVYPSLQTDGDGHPLTGQGRYILHFDHDQLPPVDAFWSVTMYDAKGFHVDNALGRFAIGDRDDLVYQPDGSLDLYLQHESPGAEREPNWLPAPEGRLGVSMRLYAPRRAVLTGTWSPPPVRRVG
jgi:hypothetical protein